MRISQFFVASSLALAVLLSGFFAQANVFVTDRRVDVWPIPVTLLPALSPVGLLISIPPKEKTGRAEDNSGDSRKIQVKPGTAFLVGECHIVTTFHTAFPNYRDKGFRPSPEHKSQFYVGRTEGSRSSFRGYRSTAEATPVQWGNYLDKTPAGEQTIGSLQNDWAILKLNDCLGRSFGFVNFAVPFRSMDERTTVVSVAGFPEDRQKNPGLTFERNCRIRTQGPGFLAGTDCGLVPGGSGGPVFEERDGVFYVIGMMTREYGPADVILPAYSDDRRSEILLVEEFTSELRSIGVIK